MVYALVFVSLALAITLGMLLFSPSRDTHLPPSEKLLGEAQARQRAEADLEKKRKELEAQRAEAADLKEQLKQAKRKLFDQREAGKGDQDLAKARAEVERGASQQLEVVRQELAQALQDVERLKAEAMGKGRRPVAPPPSPPEPQRVIRELSEADKQRMERLEEKAQEAEKEAKRLKARVETQNRVYMVTKGELELVKDKYKALEKRLNRTLLESDLVRRAIGDLEKKTGTAAGRTQLTSDEIAASDRQVDEQPNPTA